MPTTLFDLNDRVALVTGASRGIGEAIARLLAEQGAHVIISSRKKEDCDTVVDDIRAAGGSAESFACNVGKLEDISAIMSHIRDTHGRLDILINNAAANVYFGHVLDTDLEAFQKSLDVNIRGYFYMSVEGARLMREQGKGSIVNVATIGALTPTEKHRHLLYYQGRCCPYDPGIRARVCRIWYSHQCALAGHYPHQVFPPRCLSMKKTYEDAMREIPMHRHAEPEEMAGTALYLVSDASSYTNGETVLVDGGVVCLRPCAACMRRNNELLTDSGED